MEEEVKEKENWSHAWIYLECQRLFDHRALDDHYLICSFVDGELEVWKSKELIHAHPSKQSEALVEVSRLPL